MVYLPTKLGDFVRANGQVNIPAPWILWDIPYIISQLGLLFPIWLLLINGKDYPILALYEMENNPFMFQSPPTRFSSGGLCIKTLVFGS